MEDGMPCKGKYNRGHKKCRKCEDRHACRKVTREK